MTGRQDEAANAGPSGVTTRAVGSDDPGAAGSAAGSHAVSAAGSQEVGLGRQRIVSGSFGVAALASLSLTVVYAAGGQPQLEGALLALALGGIGLGLVLWSLALFGHGDAVEVRAPLHSERQQRREFLTSLERSARFGHRRRLLALAATAFGALALALALPIRSLGPTPGGALRRTPWRRGRRVVDAANRPVRPSDLVVGTVLTVFPQDAVEAEDAATLLIRVEPDRLRLPAQRQEWAPEGIVAYSKICTHVGCPVGLYDESSHRLLCPCHQSTFDVLDGARPLFGPATRPLPQLPLRVGADGYLVADGDFPEPIGPGFWSRDR